MAVEHFEPQSRRFTNFRLIYFNFIVTVVVVVVVVVHTNTLKSNVMGNFFFLRVLRFLTYPSTTNLAVERFEDVALVAVMHLALTRIPIFAVAIV